MGRRIQRGVVSFFSFLSALFFGAVVGLTAAIVAAYMLVDCAGLLYMYTVGSPSPPKPIRVKLPLPASVVRVVPARSTAKIAWVLYTQPGAPNNWLERLVQIVTQPRPSGQLWVSDTRGNGFHLVGTWPESMASSWVDIPTHFVWMPQGQKISFVHRNALYVVQTE